MDTSAKLFSLFIYICGCLAQSDSFFDIEELKNLNYGIDILSEPVVMKPKNEVPANAVFITSKYGQQYQCSFPNNVKEEKEKEEAEKVAMETGIPDLLKPMEDEPCLHKTKDWWSYELCYGKHIRQFHLTDEGQIEGEILYLGLYESEFKWDDDDQPGKDKTRNKLRKYHTQQYVNGTKCDLTKKPRRTEVRFVCEEGSGDYIARLDEPEVCAYIMTVHTTKICHHPYLKPPQPSQTVPITCSPLLSVAQYHNYLDDIAAAEEKARQKAREEEREREEQEQLQEERSKYLRDRQMETDDEGEVEVEGEGSSVEGTEAALMDDGQNWLDVMKAADGGMKTIYKVVENPDDVKQFVQEAMTEMKRLAQGNVKVMADEKGGKLGNDDDQGSEVNEEEDSEESEDEEIEESEEEKDEKEMEIDEDDELLEDFSRELKTIKQRYEGKKERLGEIREKVRQSMEKQYDAIVKEARAELAAEEGGQEVDLDRKRAYSELTDTLTTLLAKLDKTEKEINAVDKELDNFASYDNEVQTDKPKISPPTSHIKSPPVKHLGDATNTKIVQGSPKSLSSRKDDDRVKVRISRLNRGVTKDVGGGASTDKQLADLEKGVERELQAAGIEGGNKIQVKIITAGYYDDDDQTLHVLSEEESESFKNMIVSLIGGTSEANNEEMRQSQLEENYSKVWGRDRLTDISGDDTRSYSNTDGDTQTDTDTLAGSETDSDDTNTQTGASLLSNSDTQSDIEESEDT